MEILQTNNASLFETISGNRTLSPLKIKRISEDIKNGLNMLPYSPIIVSKAANGKLKIIDGQHRKEVSMVTGNPIYYVICENISLTQIAQINSRQEKWTLFDFLKCYIKIGIQDYADIQIIIDEFKVSISIAGNLLMNFNVNPDFKEKFQSGNFKSNHFDKTKQILRLSQKLFSAYTFSKDKNLILALIKIKEKGLCDFEELAKKLEQAPNEMDLQASTKLYIYNIERVYNHRNSIRKTIY